MRKIVRRQTAWLLILAMGLFGTPLPVNAADFMPLDVWEEMADWEQEQPRGGQAAIDEDDKAMTLTLDEVDKVHLSFPFDVAKDLNEMADTEGHAFEEHDRVPMKKAINPYWLPEDYQTP